MRKRRREVQEGKLNKEESETGCRYGRKEKDEEEEERASRRR